MSHLIKTINLDDAQEIARCYPVFHFLRPHLDATTFVACVQKQRAESYRIVCIEQGGEVAAAAGYRIAHFLAWGKVLYIDDLITHPEKKRHGMGSALLDWVIEQGRGLDCDEIHLDTGHHRHDAHRLYLNKGFVLGSHHMNLKLK